MKKLLISIGSIIIMACVVVLFVNAVGSRKESRKARTEVKADPATTPCSATCTADQQASEKKAASCCDPMASCAATCGSKAAGAK